MFGLFLVGYVVLNVLPDGFLNGTRRCYSVHPECFRQHRPRDRLTLQNFKRLAGMLIRQPLRFVGRAGQGMVFDRRELMSDSVNVVVGIHGNSVNLG